MGEKRYKYQATNFWWKRGRLYTYNETERLTTQKIVHAVVVGSVPTTSRAYEKAMRLGRGTRSRKCKKITTERSVYPTQDTGSKKGTVVPPWSHTNYSLIKTKSECWKNEKEIALWEPGIVSKTVLVDILLNEVFIVTEGTPRPYESSTPLQFSEGLKVSELVGWWCNWDLCTALGSHISTGKMFVCIKKALSVDIRQIHDCSSKMFWSKLLH